MSVRNEISVSGTRYLFSIEKNKLPSLVIKNTKTNQTKKIIMGEDDPAAFSYMPSIYFKCVNQDGNNKIIAVVATAPGASDTESEVKIVELTQTAIYVLTKTPWHLMIEDGFFVGKINEMLGQGAATWNFVFAPNESRADIHRYRIDLYQLKDHQLQLKKTFITQKKYDGGDAAIKELGFPFFNQLR